MALNTSQYNIIMREYDSKQLTHKRELSQRFELIYKEIPRIKEIDDTIASNSIAKGRALLLNNDEAILKELSNTNLELSMEKVELLVSKGYPHDYLNPIYTCIHCKDTGYINNEKCSCFKQVIVDMIYSQSNIKDNLDTENFDHFSYSYYSKEILYANKPSPRTNIESIVTQCQYFITNFNENHDNILFQGNAGVGKTFLTNCVAKELLDLGHTVIYLTSFQLFDALANYTFHRDDSLGTAKTTFDYVLDCELLIIDDLGTELNNSFVTSQLFLCMNERLLSKKSTIISTNLSLMQLTDAYSERVVSRITESYKIFNIYGEDIRLQKAFAGI